MESTNVRFSLPKKALRSRAARRRVSVLPSWHYSLPQALVDAVGVELGASGPMTPFAAAPLIGTTIVAGVGAAIAYAVMVKFTNRPVRNFVAVVVFAVMLVPVLLVTPFMGITPAGQGLLVLYHLLVAVPLVGFIIGAVGV